jgi:surface protein
MGALLQNTIWGRQKAIPFISTWKTDNLSGGSTNSTTIQLPFILSGTYNCSIDWGDGQSTIVTTYNQAIHTYSVAGTYIIKVKGQFSGFRFNNTADRLKLLSVQQWGDLRLGTSQGSYFYGCSNLNLSGVTDILNLTGTTSLLQCFRGCSALTTINKISEWNTAFVNSVNALFRECTNFNQNIGSWNVSNVTSFVLMFESAMNFNSGDINNWTLNTTSSIDMTSMFQNCVFNSPLNLWNTTRVTNMSSMFAYNSSFNQNIGAWNTSAVTNMSTMFQQATNFNQNIGSWNVSNVTNFTNFMSNKTNLNYSTTNLDAIYNGWSSRPVKPNITITFGTAKYTAGASAGRSILTGAPNNWVITDGGI